MCNLLDQDVSGNYSLSGVQDGVNDVSLYVEGKAIKVGHGVVPLDLEKGLKNLSSTENSPVISILAKGLKVASGVKTRIRYISFNEGVLVSLIFGQVLVRTAEGEDIELTRGVNTLSENYSNFIDADEFKTMNMVTDDVGLKCSDFVVSDCTISYKSESDLKSVKFNQDSFITIDDGSYIDARNAKIDEIEIELKKKREQQEKRLKEKEDNRIFTLEREAALKDKEKSQTKRKASPKQAVENTEMDARAFNNLMRNLSTR
jgi:hypothetical protein